MGNRSRSGGLTIFHVLSPYSALRLGATDVQLSCLPYASLTQQNCPPVTIIGGGPPVSGDCRMVAKCVPVRQNQSQSAILVNGHSSAARWPTVTIGVWARIYVLRDASGREQ
jgi:hypothetical protein